MKLQFLLRRSKQELINLCKEFSIETKAKNMEKLINSLKAVSYEALKNALNKTKALNK